MIPLRQKIAKLFYWATKPDTLRYLEEINQLQWLSRDELTYRQHQQLLDLLKYANTYIPYYQKLFKEIGFHPADFAADPANFTRLPLLTKQIVRQNHKDFITTEQNKQNKLVKVKTGGTTGEPMWLMYDSSYRAYNTAHVYQEMTWSGWQVGQSQAWLWGHPVVGGRSQVTNVKDWIANRYESNAFHITEETLEKLALHLEKHPDSVLWSYVSTMCQFAKFLEQRGQHQKLRAAYTAAEPLYDNQRELINKVLQCPVFNSYSCVEIGSIACECEQHNGLHLRTRNCYVEILQDNQVVPDGVEGEIVLTNLTNYSFPLIRYQIEDWGRKSPLACSCGRGLPMLKVVEGRIIDHFKSNDGQLVWGAFVIPMVPMLGSIKQYQIVQKSVDQLVFRVIADGPIDETKFLEIQQAVRKVLGHNVEAKLEFVDSLPATPTGKHRYTSSEVT